MAGSNATQPQEFPFPPDNSEDDLEEGEIEDGELPEEEGEEAANVKEEKCPVNIPPMKAEKVPAKQEKLNDMTVGRSVRRKHNIDRNKDPSELEEEWACVVEKKLKAAINKDGDSERTNGAEGVGECIEDEKKMKRKKRKKKHKDEGEEDRKEIKKRKRNHQWEGGEGGDEARREKGDEEGEDDEEEDEDDEMLYVRGASPIMMKNTYESDKKPANYMDKGFSFNQKGGAFDEPYDSYNEEGSDFDNRCNLPMSDDEISKRGMGRGIKRRQRAVGRMLPHNKRQTRKDTKNKRGMKRLQSGRSNIEREANVCMFYMQGKCQKGEDCPYSHNVCPPRKMELCKFYLMDCCAKKDKCLYMHHDFPCKFFHTGLKCFSGPRCKFSHGHLSDQMRSILLKGSEGNRHNELRMSTRSSVASQEHRSKHLETAPKDLLGDFPRLSRDGATAMVYKKNRGNKGKKIPSLFDIEVPIPAQLLAEQKDSSKDQSPRRTPMPESDNEENDGTSTPMPQSPVNDTKSKGKSQRWNADELSVPGQGSVPKDKSSEDDNQSNDYKDETKPLVPRLYHETDEVAVKKNDNERVKLNLHRFAGYSPTPEDEKKGSDSLDSSGGEDNDTRRKDDEKIPLSDPTAGDSGAESNDGAHIPLHLPKKQRELFLRIQQQQREAESSQDQSGEQDNEMDSLQEENWYSSDDEEDSLSNVLKNLSKQDGADVTTAVPDSEGVSNATSGAETPAAAAAAAAAGAGAGAGAGSGAAAANTSTGPVKLPDLSKIDISESFTKLLSSIYQPKATEASTTPPSCSTDPLPDEETTTATTTTTTSATAAAAAATTAAVTTSVARDPRLSRDPRHRSSAVTSTTPTTPTTPTTSAASTPNTTHDATTNAALAAAFEAFRRVDPRKSHESRSSKPGHKSESHETKHSGRRNSGSSSSSTFTSIYSNAIMGESTSTFNIGLGLNAGGAASGSGDIDLRNLFPRALETGDVDLRPSNRSDTDLRTGQAALAFGDTDLRVRSQDLLGVGQLGEASRANSDVDLRMLELPFKPVPMHTPATEIEASLTSHPPIPYKVVTVTIPRPDYTNLKLNISDPQVQSDPRLRKFFKLNVSDVPAKAPVPSASPRSDPRRQASRSSANSAIPHTAVGTPDHEHVSEHFPVPKPGGELPVQTTGPLLPSTVMRSPLLPNPTPRVGRDPRNAPGLLGPAPFPANYCPNNAFEVQADCTNIDGDPRMMYNRGPMDMPRWEQQSAKHSVSLPLPLPVPASQAPHQHSQSRGNWRSNRRNQHPRYMEQDFSQRSYTPPI